MPYRDLKLKNTWVFENKKDNKDIFFKLINLGDIASAAATDRRTSYVGTLEFMAPEVVECCTPEKFEDGPSGGNEANGYCKKADITSMAILCTILLIEKSTFLEYLDKVHEDNEKAETPKEHKDAFKLQLQWLQKELAKVLEMDISHSLNLDVRENARLCNGLLKNLLSFQPEDRFFLDKILDHPFIKLKEDESNKFSEYENKVKSVQSVTKLKLLI